MSARVLLFGGTGEGRELAGWLTRAGVDTLLCVATRYGEEISENIPGLRIHAGRLDTPGMTALIREETPALVLDATHPYARVVSQNIAESCAETGMEYIRLLRGASDTGEIHCVDSAREAAKFLDAQPGRILLTLGSKELGEFTAVSGYRDRIFARVLPDAQVVSRCNELGFSGGRLICMQGPFSHEFNAAMLRDLRISWLVTKDSGEAGGFDRKLSAARETGASVLLVSRPRGDEGLSRAEVVELLRRRFSIPFPPKPDAPEMAGHIVRDESAPKSPRFPLFVDICGKTALVAGGGAVGARRAKILLEFGAAVRLVSPALGKEAESLARDGLAQWLAREYRPEDLDGACLAVAATNDRALNADIAAHAKELGIPVSVADNPGGGDFWFPAVAVTGKTSAGLVSRGGDHSGLKATAAYIRERLREWDENH